jgi:hypothetical protein
MSIVTSSVLPHILSIDAQSLLPPVGAERRYAKRREKARRDRYICALFGCFKGVLSAVVWKIEDQASFLKVLLLQAAGSIRIVAEQSPAK